MSNQPIIVKARERFKLASSKPFKPKAWSHDNDLTAAKGKQISLHALDSPDELVGELLDSDRFTLKVRVWNGKSALTFFKHALASYAIKE